jgi:hypothetical protein
MTNLMGQWRKSPVLWIGALFILLLIAGMIILVLNYFMTAPGLYREGDFSRYSPKQAEPILYNAVPSMDKDKRSSESATGQINVKKTGLKIIKTASLRFQVKDYQKSHELILSIVKQYDGYLASENQQNGTDRITNTIVIRVPAANLDLLIDSLQGQAAYLDYKSIDARDVTEEFVDTEARLKAKREVEQRYLAVLKQAGSVEDILAVESRLGQIREEIEATEGRLRYLNDQVDYSTITIEIYQPLHRLPRAESGFLGRLGKALVNGWNGLLGFIVFLTNIWPLIVVVLAGWTGYRFWKQKR